MGTSLAWRTDTQLRDVVRRALDEDPTIRAGEIAVVASNSVVTLTGFVASYSEKSTAEAIVKRVRGVRAVANDLEVKVGDEKTDFEIAKDAVQALEGQTSVPQRVTVTVRHGRVTLEGTVEWIDQKEAAERAVKCLRGVRDVANLIQVTQLPIAIDVRNRITQALQPITDASLVCVTERGGTITLSGRVHSRAELQEAERAAWAAPGVRQVEDHLTIVS